MKNIDIRNEAAKARIKLYEIAEGLGITDSTFSRKLRKELPPEEKEKIRSVIRKIKEGVI